MESTADFEFNFKSSLESLSRCNEVLNKKLSHFTKLKTWQSQDKQALLQLLSEHILREESALPVTKFFKPVIVEILQRCFHFIQGNHGNVRDEYNERFFYIVSLLLPIVPHVQSFLLEYLTYIKPFYARLSKENVFQDADKVLIIARTAYNLLRHDFNTFSALWDWSMFFKLLDHNNTKVRWLATNIVAMVLQMSDHNKMTVVKNLFTSEQITEFMVEMDINDSVFELLAPNDQNCNKLAVDIALDTNIPQCNTIFTQDDFTENHVTISGIILPMAPNYHNEVIVKSLVKVPSTRRNLHSLAIAIATGSGVLLEGPVGSGKTCLVEYVASMTGRTATPLLTKIQLGDQTDSKSLLGTYVCTDTPGEFLWQPGTLLQAVKEGHWVLLEDIDYAPMDVVSILIPLLESRMLSIPGHGNVVNAAPGFQLFATQRTHSHSGSALHVHSSSAMLDRLWRRVNVEPPTKEELSQIISKTSSDLASVSQKLIDVYSLVSSDTNLISNADISVSSLSHDKRQSTTRDLMKWTARVAEIPVNGPFFADAKDVFLEAQDCFGATLSKAQCRLDLGMAIGAKLGINKEKVEFFYKHYRPKVQLSQHSLTVGRICLPRQPQNGLSTGHTAMNFAHTRHSLVLLERVAACIKQEEPVLLVGETGTGKTSSVQNLAAMCGYCLKVINMSQQSDSSDLLGGFKPVEMKQVIGPVKESFEQLFCQTFSRKQNVKFLSHIQQCFAKGQWEVLFQLVMHSIKAALKRIGKEDGNGESGILCQDLTAKWKDLTHKIEQLKKQQKYTENTLAFQFVEGTLVKAIRNGDWILLDEINLATPETLECLGGLLESRCGSVVLLERGDVEPVVRNEGFRLFACMNPATDVGKKDLPPGIRNRFTEIFVDELDNVNDLKILVVDYLQGLTPTAAIVDGIVRFYLTVRLEANDKLTDGTGHKPHYSLRTLCRALRYASSNPHGNILRSIYEGFCLSFLTQLDRSSHPVVESLIRTNIFGHVNANSLIKQALPCPGDRNRQFVNFEGFWISVGDREPAVPSHYVLTSSVKANLRDLARVVSGRTFPVLVQGETSVGKTSLIQWLARASGNFCVRINNHEHTDIQEYLGCYSSDDNGRLIFKEGVLVDAMRKGYWIILDELNLAPTDVLEALNRLIDDNRELFIAETQETVKAHSNFMLFATQNPPGHYGGRKVLSRAFRNRFVELHFDELPSKELEQILHLRGKIPMSYAKKMVAVLLDLQARRRSSSVFAGKQGFITLRDLFRWAERYSKTPDVSGVFYNWEQHLAEDGYMLLAGRCRNPNECSVIQEVLQIHFKSNIDPVNMYINSPIHTKMALSSHEMLDHAISQKIRGFEHVVWTKNMKRLAMLVGRALQFSEPVLLVGETGCGKTTICQLFAALKQQQLYGINCHMHSESSDFLGGLRPVRNHHLEEKEGQLPKFFEWCNGPLVVAMKEGAMFLIDEISLADDSVLERLNSVLEPERTLVLAEKGSEGGGSNDSDVDIIEADEKFRVVATMNPGGDFGKKELSPALRNRFTEIWCPSTNSDQDLVDIIEHNLTPDLCFKTTSDGNSTIGQAMVEFVNWFQTTDFGRRFVISIRDLLSWANFINVCCQSSGHMTSQDCSHKPSLHPSLAYLHGACLVFLDALGAGNSSLPLAGLPPQEAREVCMVFLRDQMKSLGIEEAMDFQLNKMSAVATGDAFGFDPFYIPRGPLTISSDLNGVYALNAPTTSQNAQRLLRALQLSRPVLLEGSPGVGKTSLVSAIAKASGHELVRINLSEQTDITDLFGADLPVEGGDPGMFTWRDGPLLTALKAGHWIVFDELNLASQSVLEGLNACFDHRAEVYIPELGMPFKVQHRKTRIFACQNPLNQGGGRKGLPKSFLNRFTQVYVEPLSKEDLLFITTSLFPNMESQILEKMIVFNMQLHHDTVVLGNWGKKGSPWEFNLRDVFRWCELYLRHKTSSSFQDTFHYAKLIYSDRMRTSEDKQRVMELLFKTFNGHQQPSHHTISNDAPWLHVTTNHLQVGYSFLHRKPCITSLSSSGWPLQILHHHLPYMESLMKCIEMGWMTILVGQRSCGKTSLVQMVAQLTGNKLDVLAMNSSMDTTELLGGFEQANLNLHWQKIIKETKKLVQRTVQSTLFKKEAIVLPSTNGEREAFELYAKWERFKKSSRTDLSSSKLEELLCILDILSELDGKCFEDRNTESLKTSALSLKKRLQSNDGNIHCGGQFEWVDGQLIEALKSGYWLLIDNVNFCSPSVLDRLNALLEPGGVLSINERGVVDGKVPTIEPHPDFRLILTMDPCYGEISRAMRNRGVEIYIPSGDDEVAGYSGFDLNVMLKGAGLHDKESCQMLLVFHKEYKAKLGGSILDLLHTAKMITNLQHKGESLKSALMTSVSQVYVRSHISDTKRQIAEDLVQLHINLASVTTKETIFISPSSPSVKEFSENSTLSHIRWLCGPLNQLLWECQSLDFLTHVVNLVMERATFSDWQLRCDVVSSFLHKSAMLNPSQHAMVNELIAMVKGVVEKLFGCCLMDSLKKASSQLCFDSGMDILPHLPYDIRLTRHLHHQIAWEQCRMEKEALLSHLCNRINLFATRLKQQALCKIKSPEKTPLYLSQHFHQGLVSMEMLPHPVISHLFPFFEVFNEFIDQLVLRDLPLEDDKLVEALESLKWSSRLYSLCTTPGAFSLELLSLHWQWFFEKTYHVFPTIMGFIGNDFPSNLMTIVNQLSQVLGTDTRLSRVHAKIIDNFGHPLAFKSEHCFQKWGKLFQLCGVLELSWKQDLVPYEMSQLSKQLKLLFTDGVKARQMLCGAIVQLLEDKPPVDTEKDKDVDDVTALLFENGLLQYQTNRPLVCEDQSMDKSDTARENTSHNAFTRVILLPFCEALASSQEHSVIAKLLDLLTKIKFSSLPINCNDKDLQRRFHVFANFLIKKTTRLPSNIAVYRFIQSILSQNEDELASLIKNMDSDLTYALLNNESHIITSLNVAKWAIATTCQDEMDSSKQPRDVGNFNLNSFLFNFLNNQSDFEKRSVGGDESLSRITIGNHGENKEQLEVLLRHIWSNADHVTNLANEKRLSELSLFASKFTQVLLSLSVLTETNHGNISKVAMAITASDNPLSLKDNLEDISSQVFDNYKKQTGSDNTSEMKKLFLEAFCDYSCCVKSRFGHSGGNTEANSFHVDSGCMWIKLGLLQTLLLCPVGPVDPVEQSAIELEYTKRELTDIKEELYVRFYADQIWTGSKTTLIEIEKQLDEGLDPSSLDLTSNPFRVKILAQNLKYAKGSERDLQRDLALRPKPSQFADVLHCIKQFRITIGNPDTVFDLMSGIQKSLSSLRLNSDPVKLGQVVNDAHNIIHRAEMWKRSQQKFMLQIKNDYPLYWDVTGPFIAAVAQVGHGMTTLSSYLQYEAQRHLFLLKCPGALSAEKVVFPDNFINMLCNQGYFLDKGNLDMVKCLMSESTWTCLQGLKNLQGQSETSRHTELTSRLLWTSLLHVQNFAKHHNYLNNQAMSLLLEILNVYSQQWAVAKDEEQEREQRHESLYKFKPTTHEGEVDEEKAFENGLCKAFPTFDNEFSEFVQANNLGEVEKQPEKPNASEDNNSSADKFMKTVDVQKITKLHERLFTEIPDCQSCSLNSGITKPCCHGEFYEELIQSGYQAAALVNVMNNEEKCLSIGEYCWEPHLLQSQCILQRLAANDHTLGRDKHYSIYHDANIPEVIKVQTVMESFKRRLYELLLEWPDNPLLILLQSFIDKILALPITSPVMKVLTGIEILLKNAQEWENNASRHVSIKSDLEQITNLVIEWRKLELKCWSSLLDVAADNASDKSSKWWFYLYSLIQQAFTTDSELSDFIDPLQRFIESSSIGEFSARLKMVYSFYKQSAAMEINNKNSKGKVSDIMLNIYSYYKQFDDTIQDQIQQARDPIEKELKGYVKIAKWNDSNFWAMKQATEKSHRTLHKFVRRYEMALGEPVRRLLIDSKNMIGSIEHVNRESQDEQLNPDWFISKSEPANQMAILEGIQLLQATAHVENLPKLFSRMKKLCRKIIRQQRYSSLTVTLTSFTGEVITGVHGLQALNITNQPKEKLKEMRKHIHLRKRTALAELFKALSSIGLSHKKGLQNVRLSSQESSMLMPGFESSHVDSMHHEIDSDLAKAARYHSNRCQYYYQRCLARMSALNVHLISPSKELTIGDLDRCKGFSHHLLTILQNQRRMLVDMTTSIKFLRVASKSLVSVVKDDGPAILPPQNDIPRQLCQFTDFLSWVSQSLQRSLHVMACCPAGLFTDDCSPVPTDMLSTVSISSSNSEIIQDIRTTLLSCQMSVDDITSEIRPYAVAMENQISGSDVGDFVLATWEYVNALSTSVQTLRNIARKISSLFHHFESSGHKEMGLGSRLCYLTRRIAGECDRLEVWNQTLLLDSTKHELTLSIGNTMEKTVTTLLLAVQRISKATETRDEQFTKEEAEEDSLLDGHLVTLIYQDMTDDIAKLDTSAVLSSVMAFISELKALAPANQLNRDSGSEDIVTRYLMSSLVSVLDQYIYLADSFFLSLLTAHQTSCKLLSVLVGIFSELLGKGFCLPPEVEDEESGEGATEFDDIQDGGLGEGEGAKDVSDQIESEDQLQDAKKDGQNDENQSSNERQLPDEENGIEMSEDFDGAIHDVECEEQGEDEPSDDKEEELDKQMGELDGEEDEKLDEKLWGDSDDDEDEKENKEAESDKGAGAEAEAESEMVAKEDNRDAVDKSKEKEQEPKDDSEETVNELPKQDLGNLSDEELDPQGEGREEIVPENEADDLDLPDNLKLEDEKDNQESGGEMEDGTEEMENGMEEAADEEKQTGTETNDEQNMEVDEEETQEDEEQGEAGETEDFKQEENEGNQDENKPNEDDHEQDWRTQHHTKAQDVVQATDDITANDGGANQSEVIEQSAGQRKPNDNQDQQGVGSARALGNDGHSGEAEVTSAQAATDTKQQQRKQMNRSRSDRSLGTMDERTHKRLKTVEDSDSLPPQESDIKKTSDLYQHFKGDGSSSHDAQTLDSATADQSREQDKSRFPEHISDNDDDTDDDDDEIMECDDAVLREKDEHLKQFLQQTNNPQVTESDMKPCEEIADREDLRTNLESCDNERHPDRSTTYHVSSEAFWNEKLKFSIDQDKLRSDLEHQLSIWSNLDRGTLDEQRVAKSAWNKYELLTSSLAQELCEQLRLVLEPSLATKLKGDYRTGKRLNMRKVIPYIASQFRKDKIWLRRTKPSKRQYQVMIAVDDSSSMADNHSKQLAFESLAVISKALTRLEVGDLAVCSFGETVKLLHPLHEPFNDQSGARILQQFKFDQKKTKIAQLVSTCSSLMLSSKSRLSSGPRSLSVTSQLLLVVSDGRGIFFEGTETVRRTVRAAKEAGIFLVFVIIDNPVNRDSILDIKVPIFRPGKAPEIKSYIEQFPFPFYVILRDINSLPTTLSDALRQWFELVTSMED